MAVFSAMVSAKELCAIFEQRLVAHQDNGASDFARMAERLHLTADSLHTLPALGFAEVVTLDAELADALAFCDAEVLDPVTGCRKALVRAPGTEWQLVGVVSCGHQLQPETLLPPLLTDADMTGLITTCSVGPAAATTTATTSGAQEAAGLSGHCSCTGRATIAAAARGVPLVWRWAGSVVGATLPAELFNSASAAANAISAGASKTSSAEASATKTVHSCATHNCSNDDGVCGVEWTLKTGGEEAAQRGGSLLALGRGVERDGKGQQQQQARKKEQAGKEGKEQQQEDEDAEDDEGTAVLALLALPAPPPQQQPQQPQPHGAAAATGRAPALTSFKSATSDGDRTTRAAGGLRSLARAAHLGLSASFTARGVATSKWVINNATSGSLTASNKVAATASGSAAAPASMACTCSTSVATGATTAAAAAPVAPAAAACSALDTLDQKVRLGARKLAALARMILSPPPQRTASPSTATAAAASATTKGRMSCSASLRAGCGEPSVGPAAASGPAPRKGLSAVSMPLPRIRPLALPPPAVAVAARANLPLAAPVVAPFLAHSVPLMSH